MVKRTPKWKRDLIGGIEKALIEVFEESTLWNVSGQDMVHNSVETSAVIVGIALIGQSSLEAMAKEIARLKQLTTQDQNELAENINNATKDKQRSLEELRIDL